jgi:hypothetical protein
MEPTKEEQIAIKALRRLEKQWPDTLWLFATGNGIHVMRRGANGEHVMNQFGSPDVACELEYITGIDNDGGDF